MFEHVIHYDKGLPYEELYAIYEILEAQHGRGKFLFIPNELTYSSFDLNNMKKIRDQMNEIIKEAENANQEIT